MSSIVVPDDADQLWPTLGFEVCAFIEAFLVHGPGDVLGAPVELTDEQRFFIYRAYEVFPRGHEQEGRRRFKQAVLSRRKGWSKTELAAWLAIVESHPEGPVRCDGFKKIEGEWTPVGRPVTDPYIPMVAVTEEQTEDLAYGAVHAILTEDTCPIGGDYDVGLERTLIIRHGASGEIKPLASAPKSRDGARTTFQHFDETHLFTDTRLKASYRTMQRNIPKRRAADAWSLETTTAYAPGEMSVAEDSHLHAEQVQAGELEDSRLYFDHAQASEHHDITTDEGLREAITEASRDAIAWTDMSSIVSLFRHPKNPVSESRRYWLNQPRASADRWITPLVWELAESPREVTGPVYLGFWGGVNRTSAGLIGATADGYLFVVDYWEPTPGLRITDDEVEAAVTTAVDEWQPEELVTSRTGGSGWISQIEAWSDRYGNIVEIPVNSPARMGPACDRFYTAAHDTTERALTHDGHPALARHIANCVPAISVHGTYIRPGPGENQHIDLARAAVLAYERAMTPAAEPVDPATQIW